VKKYPEGGFDRKNQIQYILIAPDAKSDREGMLSLSMTCLENI
jgi:hypothetical protein